MVQRAQSRSDRTTLKQRREQVVERLAAFGLTRGPHRIVRSDRMWEREASLGLKLRLAFSDLGPIFSSFGRYLATRVDLLPAADCLELEAIPDACDTDVLHRRGAVDRRAGSDVLRKRFFFPLKVSPSSRACYTNCTMRVCVRTGCR